MTSEVHQKLEEIFVLLDFNNFTYEHLIWLTYFDEKKFNSVYQETKDFYKNKVLKKLIQKEDECMKKFKEKEKEKEKFLLHFFLEKRLNEIMQNANETNTDKIKEFEYYIDLFYSEENKEKRKNMKELKKEIFKSLLKITNPNVLVKRDEILWKLLKKYSEREMERDDLFKNILIQEQPPCIEVLNRIFSYDEKQYGAIQMQFFDATHIQQQLLVTISLNSLSKRYVFLFSTDMFWKLCEQITKDFAVNTDLCKYQLQGSKDLIPLKNNYSKLLSEVFQQKTQININLIKETFYTSDIDIYWKNGKFRSEITKFFKDKKSHISKLVGEPFLPETIDSSKKEDLIKLHKIFSIEVNKNYNEIKLNFKVRCFQDQLRAKFFYNIRKGKSKYTDEQLNTYESSLINIHKSKNIMIYWPNTYERLWEDNKYSLLIYWVNAMKKIFILKKQNNEHIEHVQTVIKEITDNIKNESLNNFFENVPHSLDEMNFKTVINHIDSSQCFLYLGYCFFILKDQEMGLYFEKIKEKQKQLIQNSIELKLTSEYFDDSLFIPNSEENNFYYQHVLKLVLSGKDFKNKNKLLCKLFANYAWDNKTFNTVCKDIKNIIQFYNENNKVDENCWELLCALLTTYKTTNINIDPDLQTFINNVIKCFVKALRNNINDLSNGDFQIITNLLKYGYEIMKGALKEFISKGKERSSSININEILLFLSNLITQLPRKRRNERNEFEYGEKNVFSNIKEMQDQVFNKLGSFMENSDKKRIENIFKEILTYAKNVSNEKDFYIINTMYEGLKNIMVKNIGESSKELISRLQENVISVLKRSLVTKTLKETQDCFNKLFFYLKQHIKERNNSVIQEISKVIPDTQLKSLNNNNFKQHENSNQNEYIEMARNSLVLAINQQFQKILTSLGVENKYGKEQYNNFIQYIISETMRRIQETSKREFVKEIKYLLKNTLYKLQGFIKEEQLNLLKLLYSNLSKVKETLINEEDVNIIQQQFNVILNEMKDFKHQNNLIIIKNLLNEKYEELVSNKILIKDKLTDILNVLKDNNQFFKISALQHLLILNSYNLKQSLENILFSYLDSLNWIKNFLTNSERPTNNILSFLFLLKILKIDENQREMNGQNVYNYLFDVTKTKEYLYEKLLENLEQFDWTTNAERKIIDEKSLNFILDFIDLTEDKSKQLINALFYNYFFGPKNAFPQHINKLIKKIFTYIFELTLEKCELNEIIKIYPKQSDFTIKILMYMYSQFISQIQKNLNKSETELLAVCQKLFPMLIFIITSFTKEQHNICLDNEAIKNFLSDQKMKSLIIKMFSLSEKQKEQCKISGDSLIVGMFILLKCKFNPSAYSPFLKATDWNRQIIKLLFNDKYLQERILQFEPKSFLYKYFKLLKEENEFSKDIPNYGNPGDFLKYLTVNDRNFKFRGKLINFIEEDLKLEHLEKFENNGEITNKCLFIKTHKLSYKDITNEKLTIISCPLMLETYSLKGILIYKDNYWESYLTTNLNEQDKWFDKNNILISRDKIQLSNHFVNHSFTTILFYTAVDRSKYPEYSDSTVGVKDYGKNVLTELFNAINLNDRKQLIGLFSILIDKVNLDDKKNLNIYKNYFKNEMNEYLSQASEFLEEKELNALFYNQSTDDEEAYKQETHIRRDNENAPSHYGNQIYGNFQRSKEKNPHSFEHQMDQRQNINNPLHYRPQMYLNNPRLNEYNLPNFDQHLHEDFQELEFDKEYNIWNDDLDEHVNEKSRRINK